MKTEEQDDKTIYKVVVNHEEQYSIWPAHRENALGWNDAGKSGTRGIMAYIKEVGRHAPLESQEGPGVVGRGR